MKNICHTAFYSAPNERELSKTFGVETSARYQSLSSEATFGQSRASTSTKENNKAGYTATLVACGWAGAVLEKVTRASGQEPYAQKAQKRQKSNCRKSVRWSAVPVACLSKLWLKLRGEQGSGPQGVNDLYFHTYGEFSPPSHPPSLSLQAHISAWRPISQPQGPNPSLEAQIP